MSVSQNDSAFQLQLWNGREFVTTADGTCDSLRDAFDAHVGTGRRLVLTEKARDARPKMRSERRAVRPNPESYREKRHVQAAYLEWAVAKGLKQVTVYRGSYVSVSGALSVREVDPSDFIGPAPAPEIEEAIAA